jgi:hypothetical protein
MKIKSDDAGTTIIINMSLPELASIDSQENGDSARSISAA